MIQVKFKRHLAVFLGLWGFCAAVFAQGLYGPEQQMTALEKRLEQALEAAEIQPEVAQKEAEQILHELSPEELNYRVDSWVILSKAHLFQGKTDLALQWAEKAKVFAKEQGYLDKELLADYAKILVLKNRSQLEAMNSLAQQTLKRAEQSGYDYLAMINANVLGASYTRLGEFDSAILYFQKALDYSKSLGDLNNEAKMLNNLSSVFISMKNFSESLKYMDNGIELMERSGNKASLIVMLVNKAYLLDELGQIEAQEAILQKALSMAKEVGSLRLEAAAISNLADLILHRGDYQQAADLAKRGYEIFAELGNTYEKRVTRVTYGQALFYLGEQDEAMAIFKQSLEAFQQDKMEAEVVEVTRIIADCYEQAGNYKDALAFQKSYKQKSDAVFQSASQKMATELNAKYESARKEQEILLLSKDNQIKTDELQLRQYQRNIVLIIAASVLLVTALVFQRLYASRRNNRKLEALNKELSDLSLKDTLTGLYNRRYFHSHIDNHLSYAVRHEQDQKSSTGNIGFLMIDVDHFKHINDQLGHHAGDLALKEFSKRLTNVFRGSDIVVRWGGEEFLVTVRDATLEGVKQLAHRLLQEISSEPFVLEGKSITITCSAGFCCYPFFAQDDFWNWEKVIRLADLALYKAKNSGRNTALGVCPGENVTSEQEGEIILDQFELALEQKLVRIV